MNLLQTLSFAILTLADNPEDSPEAQAQPVREFLGPVSAVIDSVIEQARRKCDSKSAFTALPDTNSIKISNWIRKENLANRELLKEWMKTNSLSCDITPVIYSDTMASLRDLIVYRFNISSE